MIIAGIAIYDSAPPWIVIVEVSVKAVLHRVHSGDQAATFWTRKINKQILS
jgi:hypothetical protein